MREDRLYISIEEAEKEGKSIGDLDNLAFYRSQIFQLYKNLYNKSGCINNHTGDQFPHVTGVVVDGAGRIGAWLDGPGSLNEIFIGNDGVLHIGTSSVGGQIIGDLNEDTIKRYNSRCILESFKIVDWIKF